MRRTDKEPRRGLSSAARDFIVIASITAGVLIVFRVFGIRRLIDVLDEKIGPLILHDFFITSIVLIAALAAYSLLRWKHSSTEVLKRQQAEAALQRHQDSLEKDVEERTSSLRKVNEELEQEIAERRQAVQEANESGKFLDTIFHSIRDPFCIIDSDYRIVRLNEAYAQMRETTVENLMGEKCQDTLKERNVECADCIVEKTFVSGDPCAEEKPCPINEGMWIEVFTYPISLNGSGVTHVIEYIRDITPRKRSEDEHRRLIKKLEHISNTDALTGLLNRRAIIGALESEVERAKRYGTELSVLLCDIDFFKDTNDTFGHEAGDRALVAVAGAICGVSRDSDLIGRYGGDEFMIIFPNTGAEGARVLADRIISQVSGTAIEVPEGETFNVTLSIGISELHTEDDEPDTLIRRADKGMYASKRAGRNMITVEGQESLPQA